MAGYSNTPLVQKLGIKPGFRIFVEGAPADYGAIVGPLPYGAAVVTRLTLEVDLVHLFATERAALERRLTGIHRRIKADAIIWVSWPKKASGVRTDITENIVREIALPLGLVDVKVCAVDDTWSGLKLVIRTELRGR